MRLNSNSRGFQWMVCLSIVLTLASCNNASEKIFGPISYPKDNAYRKEVAEFGKTLFFDKRLSADNSISCASCHVPSKAFTDGLAKSKGIHGKIAFRNAPSLLNVAYQKTLMADGQIPSLEMQALVPLQDTAEMANNMGELIRKLKAITFYQKKAKELFNRDFDAFVLTRSLAQFERTLLAKVAPFDEWYYHGNENAISVKAKKGWKIVTEELYCAKCHPAPFFTNFKVENNGFYSQLENHTDEGRFRITGDSSEIGSFKVPSLRNLSKTGPYMHNGSIKSIDEILEYYAKGGSKSKQQNKIIQPFILTNEKKESIKAFLKSLGD